jgi:Zn-dependent protease
MEWVLDALAWVIPVVLAITLHEAAHGWMAEKFGDDTARRLGRVTFNPLRHVDRYGTIVFPGILFLAGSPVLFGYAKPVPVNFQQLRPARFGMFAVALAGPLANVAQALFAGFCLHVERWVTPEEAPFLFESLYRMVMVNCVIAVFNLLPLLPLDGGRVVDSFLRSPLREAYRRLEPYGIYIVVAALLVPQLMGMEGLLMVIEAPVMWMVAQILWLTGNG